MFLAADNMNMLKHQLHVGQEWIIGKSTQSDLTGGTGHEAEAM